jgi:hypothetical protein
MGIASPCDHAATLFTRRAAPGQHLPGIGNLLAQSSAIYPDAERVLFFYTGKVPEWQINVQTCRRR